MFSLLQIYETAQEKEFLAADHEELAGASGPSPRRRLVQQVVANNLASIRPSSASSRPRRRLRRAARRHRRGHDLGGGVRGRVAATVASGGDRRRRPGGASAPGVAWRPTGRGRSGPWQRRHRPR